MRSIRAESQAIGLEGIDREREDARELDQVASLILKDVSSASAWRAARERADRLNAREDLSRRREANGKGRSGEVVRARLSD